MFPALLLVLDFHQAFLSHGCRSCLDYVEIPQVISHPLVHGTLVAYRTPVADENPAFHS